MIRSKPHKTLAAIRKALLVLLGITCLIVLGILYQDLLKDNSKAEGLPKHPASSISQPHLSPRKHSGGSFNKRPLEDYLKVFNTRDVFKPTSKLIMKNVLTKIKEGWGIKLTGTIIAPPAPPAAFIIDEAGNEEVYYEGDTIGRWTVKQIQPEQVTLEDAQNNQIVLRIEQVAQPLPSQEGMEEIARQIITQPGQPIPEEFLNQLKSVIESSPPEVIRDQIEKFTGIPQEVIPPETNLTEYIAGLYQMTQDGVLQRDSAKLAPIYFCIKVNPDNSPQDPTTVFTLFDRKVYGCFANQGKLQGLKNIITRWTDSNGHLLRMSTLTLDPAAPYNWVALTKKTAWEKGSYSLELFKPSTLKKLAQGTFQFK